ncbi:MAG: tRNA (adenosine(37)-N6)-threonylcarbamoyltransferase complex ATPase subunit type 1 TsaE [Candidatus Omnitrophica bacterium]|nr:tRNA (adenosine(37)-N6)-threonylcarbamoyltransferase complex ATPase subunit type 1 TsaE [Candidatus Omnitrophota bacterium]MBD3269829.1 tRNA (adenosine(37)-N6)-threonylcarbamoyltransferase complex ATPase subunit type 1 TsaE [Candidatus Omnitrophota bacterium]
MRQKFTLNSRSPDVTIRYGRSFANILEERDVVILEGNLGGGKTTFVKGVVRGLGFAKRVMSPSFVLMRVYKTKKFTVNHFDFYRLGREEITGLGMEEIIASPGSLNVIEWGGIYQNELDRFIRIDFRYRNYEKRDLIFSFKGYSDKRYKKIKAALIN